MQEYLWEAAQQRCQSWRVTIPSSAALMPSVAPRHLAVPDPAATPYCELPFAVGEGAGLCSQEPVPNQGFASPPEHPTSPAAGKSEPEPGAVSVLYGTAWSACVG